MSAGRPVSVRLDLPDPGTRVLLALHRQDPVRFPALFESGGGAARNARHDILFIASGEALFRDRTGRVRPEGGAPEPGKFAFLEALDAWWQRLRVDPEEDGGPPFSGGWLVFMGYELAADLDSDRREALAVPVAPAPALSLPVAAALRCPAALVRDRLTGQACLVAEPGHEALASWTRAALAAVGEVARASPERVVPGRLTEEPAQQFLDGVGRVLEHIAAGEVQQVNLSREWQIELKAEVPDAALHERLLACNPAPFAALARIGGATLFSSSPERLFRVRRGIVEARPIAGTHPRGRTPGEDAALLEALRAHPKEQAEHRILAEVVREDLEGITQAGSLRVDEAMTTETYAHVHHLVSNLWGRLRPEATPGRTIAALFPGGSITGLPRGRSMAIIRELEKVERGAYTGALGYLGRSGDMDFNILIRTLVREGGRLWLRAGSGIVAESDPMRELEETRAKARGLLRVFDDDL